MSFPLRLPRAAARAALLLAMAGTAGCAAQGEFPSLAPRAAEHEDPLAEPVRTLPTAPSDAALRARTSELLAQAQEGERAFDAAYAPALAAARAAGGQGSESWVEAQQAVSRAEAARAATTAALAALDALALERANVPTDAGDFENLREALGLVSALSAEQQRRLDGLRATIRR